MRYLSSLTEFGIPYGSPAILVLFTDGANLFNAIQLENHILKYVQVVNKIRKEMRGDSVMRGRRR